MTIKRVQVVSLHCALDEKTKHLMNAERLKMMKPDAILVNAARGGVQDEVALVEHLKANPNFRCASELCHRHKLPCLCAAAALACLTGKLGN